MLEGPVMEHTMLLYSATNQGKHGKREGTQVVRAFVIFCTNEEGHPLETSTDDKCFFSPAITDGLVTLARLYRHFTIPRFTD